MHVVCVDGPAYDLLHTMSKLLNCGLPLADVIGMATSRPALAMRRPELGHLGVGAVGGHLGAAGRSDSNFVFKDVVGVTRQGTTLLQPVACYLAGKEMEVTHRPFEEPFVNGHAQSR